VRGLLVVLALAACGKDVDEAGSEVEEFVAPGARPYAADIGTTALRGVAKFAGEPRARSPLDMGTERYCVQAHDEPPETETLVVGTDGGVANVLVRVTGGLEGWKFPRGEGEVVLDQRGCIYVPHVLAMRVGQTLRVRNGDAILHNVHGFRLPQEREVFNWAQITKGVENAYRARRPELIHVRCDVHPWMGAYVWILRHPFFAVTGEDGAFAIAGLPPGSYEVEAWHEELGTWTQSVTLRDGETAEIAFRLE